MDFAKLRFWETPRCVLHRSAQGEFFVTLVVSICPLLATIAAFWFTQTNPALRPALEFAAGEGQLIIYAATLIAPVFYSTLKDPPMKGKNWFFISSLVLLVLSVSFQIFFSMDKVEQKMVSVSYIFAGAALTIFYLNLYFVRKIEQAPSAPGLQTKANTEFTQDFDVYLAEHEE